MTFNQETEFKFERLTDSDIIIERFEAEGVGFVALAWDEVGEQPYLHLALADGRTWNDLNLVNTWTYNEEAGEFLDAHPDFRTLLPQAHEAMLLHAQIRISHDIEGRTGYDYLSRRPHIKLFINNVGAHYDEDWRKEMHVADVEEVWMYDDARRTHICSFTGSAEAWAIEEREVMEEGYEDDDFARDRANSELEGMNPSIDYFSDPVMADHDAGPASDSEVLALMTGETTYEEFMESWQEYFRSNSVV